MIDTLKSLAFDISKSAGNIDVYVSSLAIIGFLRNASHTVFVRWDMVWKKVISRKKIIIKSKNKYITGVIASNKPVNTVQLLYYVQLRLDNQVLS